MTQPRTALIAGATGLVGGHVLRLLLADPAYTAVTALARRDLGLTHPKLKTLKVDFDRLESLAPFPSATDVFCCLGTTIKQAGSQEAFHKVDFTYTHEVARLAARQGARQLLLVSSLGANPESRVFYSRVKGKLEAAVRTLPYQGIHIFRPSLLLGERTEVRIGERAGMVLSRALGWAFVGPLATYRPIEAETVARAMIAVAKQDRPGVTVYESHEIQRLG